MDYENFYGVSEDEINLIAVAFIKRLKMLTNSEIIIYSDLYNTLNTFSESVANEGNLWIAYYNDKQDLIYLTSNWNTYIGIQYTSTGIVSGIEGYVDRDLFSKEIFVESTPPPEPSKPNTNYLTYIVQPGDTLSYIALKYNTTVQEIAILNGITNVNLIYSGQILKINSDYSNNSSNVITYLIKPGDTLYAISKAYNIPISSIVKWNNIKNPNLIYAGDYLTIYTNNSNNTNNRIIYYTVRPGDTLWRISRMYNTTIKRLAYINGIRIPSLIYVRSSFKNILKKITRKFWRSFLNIKLLTLP